MSIFRSLLFLPALVGIAHAETLLGRVVSVADGDTVTVLDASNLQHKIRLQGIDAPEKAQPFGERSKQSLSRMVFGKDVRVEGAKRDKYKRIVGKVWVQPDGCPSCPMTLDAGHAQITAGLAWWYRKYANEQSPKDRGAYEFSEQEARAKRVGLWSNPDPTPPWEWRDQQRAPAKTPLPQIAWALVDAAGKVVASRKPGQPIRGTADAALLAQCSLYITKPGRNVA